MLSRECPVYTSAGRQTFVIYATESAKKHSGSTGPDDLRMYLQMALNAKQKDQIPQNDGSIKVLINDKKGYVVFKLNSPGPREAKIFHFHKNYDLDKHHKDI